MGNQLLAKAAGATIYKLKYGHRSHNQPVRLLGTEKCYVTSQNHGYAVDATTLTVRFEDVWELTPPELRATSYSVNILRDGACAILPGIAPDARLFIDLVANGGFLFTFTPEEAAG